MHNYKKITILLLLITYVVISSLFTNCRKTKTVEVEKDVIIHDTISSAWKVDTFFNGKDQNILNAGFTDKYLFYFCLNTSYIVDTTNLNSLGAVDNGVFYYAPFYNENWNNKKAPIITLNYGINYSSNKVSVFKPFFTGGFFMPVFPDLKSIDTSFKNIGYGFNSNYFNPVSCSDNNRVLVPIVSSQYQKSHFCCFDIIINPTSFSITNTQTVIINNSNNVNDNPPVIIGSLGNRFLIYNSGSVYLIREDYSVKYIFNKDITNLFKFNNYYYTVDSYNGIIYKSTDMGETWIQLYQISSIAALGKFIEMDGKLLLIVNDQIWQLDLQPTSLVIKEINNNGLKGKFITNVLKFKNKVLVTTKSGLYYRYSNKFYEFK